MNAPSTSLRSGNGYLPGLRFVLVALALTLTALGVVFVHSTTTGGDAPFPGTQARRQMLKAILGIAAFFFVSRFDYRLFDRWAYAAYGGLIVVLSVMLILSDSLLRSINLYVFQVQPSELMKLALVLCLARYLRYRRDQNTVRGLLLPFVLTVVPMYLVLRQPDLGTSLMFPPVLLGMMFVAGANRRHIAVAVVVGLSLLPAAYLAYSLGLPVFHQYQFQRLESFVRRDESTRNDSGYQLHQSEIAIGSGGFQGKGYQQGTQNKLGFLPARHTDFVFSVIAEELGFVGASFTVGASFLLAFVVLRIASRTKEPFGRLVATGVGVQFAAQSFQNIAMAMGLTPITGLTLPLVSFGGSSLVASYLALGVVYGIASRRVQVIATRDLSPYEAPRYVPLVDDSSAGTISRRWPVA